MAKYKVGDKVRIVSQMPNHPVFGPCMKKYLGKTLTVRNVVEDSTGARYEFDEAYLIPIYGMYWWFSEAWIAGLIKPKPKKESGLRVVIRFDGNVTTARMIRGGTVVKTATARCSPKDQYSHAEGARVAMERLFAKKEEQP
nr:MAG TPA: hypothetical protein [Caudoviricetes sp.]